MQDFTKKKNKKIAPIICAGVVVLVLLIYLGVVIYPLLAIEGAELLGTGFLIFYGLIILAVIAGVILALRSRLQEIEGGEEDEAGKY